MEETIIESKEDIWPKKQKELLDGIHETMEKGSVDVEVLEIMRKLIKNAKARRSIVNYYNGV